MKIKREIFSFSINKNELRDVTEETKDGILTKKEEVSVPYKIILKYPSRLEMEKADEEYSIKYGDCIRKNILPRALVEKVYGNSEGFLSEPEKNKYADSYMKLYTLQNEYTRLNIKTDKTEDEKVKLDELTRELVSAQRDLQNLEAVKNSLFTHTAENKAQNHQIMWLTLNLTYIQDGDKDPAPLFKGILLEDKLAYYDEIMDNQDEQSKFYQKIIDKSNLFITLWVLNKVEDAAEFKEINENLEKEVE